MKDIDELIKQALSEEDSAILASLKEESVFEMLTSTFKGKLKWLSMYVALMILVFFVLGIYCLIEFINAEITRDLLRWGAAMFACLMAVGLLKTWHWMQMDKNSLMREIKRLELQVSLLVKKMNAGLNKP